jgi:hypothetical protein
MSSRRPLQPIPALSANVLSTRNTRNTTTTKAADGSLVMDNHVQEDVQDSGSVVSGLTSLEGDDDFERLMIQNARDERRLNEALHGRAQPFRKARTHARVGLTIDNLERNDAQTTSNVPHVNARIASKSPPSSTGSTHSDPAIHAPASWGRKGRSNRNWMRNITRDEQPQPQPTPAPPDDDSLHHLHDYNSADAPRRSVEDSPLSHKSFNQGTPRNDNSGEWDLTFELNEASIIASTPYIPRNTKLDDIREREIESLREQGVATARLDRIRENSPEEMRRPQSSPGKSTNTIGTANSETQPQEQGSPLRKLHKRTNSWQSLSKSQPELGKQSSPIAVYRKSVETVGLVERDVVANAQRQPNRPMGNRRTDSQDLLRRLARASNTPSPKASPPVRSQNAPAMQPHSSSHTAVDDMSNTTPDGKEKVTSEMPAQGTIANSDAATQEQIQQKRQDTPHDGTTPDVPPSAPAEDVDATPMPVERTVLNPKTPVVMGGWIDTPGPRTTHKPIELPRPRSQSPKKVSPRKSQSPGKSAAVEIKQTVAAASDAAPVSLPRPHLPSSALHALVQEARASHDYGEDTIHSLEDLMTPPGDNEAEEDTLQGLTLPTTAPRNEAERERQAEVVQIHRLHEHLRATSTSIRDANRGMRRVETRMEHIEVGETGHKVPVIVQDHSHEFSPWKWFSGFFWDERLKTRREVDNTPWKMWGGITGFGILLTVLFIWWASETVAWYVLSFPIFILLSLG